MGMWKPVRDRAGMRLVVRALSVVAVASVSSAAIGEPFIAGTAPDRRPEGAPKLQTFDKSQQWYGVATSGVSQPFPPSLRFLEDQGAWYTPFIAPGMPGRYDIRKLHKN